jgi:hypothetical protein
MVNRFTSYATGPAGGFWTLDRVKLSASVERVRGNVNDLLVKMTKWVDEAFNEIALDWMNEAQRRLAPQQRSGELHNSAQIDATTIENDALVKRFGFNAVYASFRDHGGTINAKRSDNLAIPLAPILDGRGVSRYQTPRQEPKLFPIKTKAGKVFLAMEVGGRLEFHWKLQPSVTQRGSFYFSSVVTERKPHVAGLVGALFARRLEEENRAA